VLAETWLQIVVSDLFAAGTETTSTTISWALLLFLHHPHVQDKCFQEIQQVTGGTRPPCMRDRPDMTYMEATILEVLRWTDITPLGGTRSTSSDVTFRGYVLPKGTVVLTYLDSVLHDPAIWGDTDNFRPERFIGPDGKLTKPDEFIPFGVGELAMTTT
jgi:cytochrome P450